MTFAGIAWTVYGLILLLICLRILYETHSSTKTLAYLLFCIFFPVIGIGFYLAFGINYWKTKAYSGKQREDERLLEAMHALIKADDTAANVIYPPDDNDELASMLVRSLRSPVTANNAVKLLINGEEKFPEVMLALQNAKQHIHLEYYIYEQDKIGSEIIELLIVKAREGIEVRFIYDDFGSPSIKKKVEKKMTEAGIEVFPFSKIHFYLLANRINYRNHRKIIVVDGETGFVGGINVSDKYINNKQGQLYWRDTHLRIDGPGVFYLQYLFMADWNFCCSNKLKPEIKYFNPGHLGKGNTMLQVAGSGPDSEHPSVLFSLLQAVYLAKKEVLITTPYFIPGDSIMDALRTAALSGVHVKLLVPGKCDSRLVNAASKANYNELLQAGVEIYVYQKGFVHSKTMVTDGSLSIIGTANMDHRSFELNFEVNAILYDTPFSENLRKVFFKDLEAAVQLDPETWHKRPFLHQLPEKLARLLSPSL
jgi:cardiolipin synthase A/B